MALKWAFWRVPVLEGFEGKPKERQRFASFPTFLTHTPAMQICQGFVRWGRSTGGIPWSNQKSAPLDAWCEGCQAKRHKTKKGDLQGDWPTRRRALGGQGTQSFQILSTTFFCKKG